MFLLFDQNLNSHMIWHEVLVLTCDDCNIHFQILFQHATGCNSIDMAFVLFIVFTVWTNQSVTPTKSISVGKKLCTTKFGR